MLKIPDRFAKVTGIFEINIDNIWKKADNICRIICCISRIGEI